MEYGMGYVFSVYYPAYPLHMNKYHHWFVEKFPWLTFHISPLLSEGCKGNGVPSLLMSNHPKN